MKKRVTRAAALLAAFALITAYCVSDSEIIGKSSSTGATEGTIAANVGILEALEAQNTEEVQAVVDASKPQETDSGFEYYFFTHDADSIDPAEYRSIFSGCVVMGDSIATGLVEYEFLAEDQVVAKKGLTMNQAESKGYVELVQALNPQVIFLSFGLNDLILYKGDPDKLYNRYVSFLQLIHEACPDARVYVNSIFPVVSPMVDEKPYLADIPQYNILLWYACSENNAVFIDNTSIATADRYADDGAHFRRTMYKYWLYDMAVYAFLK